MNLGLDSILLQDLKELRGPMGSGDDILLIWVSLFSTDEANIPAGKGHVACAYDRNHSPGAADM